MPIPFRSRDPEPLWSAGGVTLGLSDIHAGYGKKEVLGGLSLDVREGEIAALIGPNGAGKSTVLKVASGLVSPRSGTVSLAGRDVTRWPPLRRFRLGLGYLMQGGPVFPTLSVGDNLRLSGLGIATGARDAALDRALALFPVLKERWTRDAASLSGGQRQSLALAMVLARSPRILLLDEPTAGLSPRLVSELLSQLRALSRDTGVGVLLVEQNLRAALAVADRALALADGRLALDTDDPRSLLGSEALEKVFLLPKREPRAGP